jgi:hypothetical protein
MPDLSATEKAVVVGKDFVKKMWDGKEFMKKMWGGQVTILKIYLICCIIVSVMGISYYVKTAKNKSKINNYDMELEYVKGSSIGSISKTEGRFYHDLRDYYIASSYNSCCGGEFQNDYVDLEPLKEVIKAGARLLDFEVYSVDGKAVVAASPSDSYEIKGTYNSIPISAVLETISRYAFSPGFCNNSEDPLFLHFRFKTDNTNIYHEMKTTLLSEETNLASRLLPTKYGKEGRNGTGNIVQVPLLEFKGKVIIIAQNDSNNFRDSKFEDLVNMSTAVPFLNSVRNYGVQYTHDPNGFKEFNKKNMTLTMPDLSALNKNVPALLHQQYGCQFVCMNYANMESNMTYYLKMFNSNGTAFVLKPENLRYKVTTIAPPKKQNPKLSYAKKMISLPMFKSPI